VAVQSKLGNQYTKFPRCFHDLPPNECEEGSVALHGPSL
jgi:hypothetical protein